MNIDPMEVPHKGYPPPLDNQPRITYNDFASSTPIHKLDVGALQIAMIADIL